MEEKSHLTPNNGEPFIRVEKLKTKPKKSCLFKVLAGLLFVFIGLPVIAVLIMIPVGMVKAGDYKVLCVIFSLMLLVLTGVSGIMGLRKAINEEYYLHEGTVDIFQSILIGSLNLTGIVLLGYSMFYDQSPAWLAIPGGILFVFSFLWAIVCVRKANEQMSGKDLVIAASGRMFLISLGTIISFLMAAAAVALRDTLRAKGSSASVRVAEALDFNLKSVRIWGKNMFDKEIVMFTAVLGLVIYIGKKTWLLMAATSNDRKKNAFTAFTYGVCSLAVTVPMFIGVMALVNHTKVQISTASAGAEQAVVLVQSVSSESAQSAENGNVKSDTVIETEDKGQQEESEDISTPIPPDDEVNNSASAAEPGHIQEYQSATADESPQPEPVQVARISFVPLTEGVIVDSVNEMDCSEAEGEFAGFQRKLGEEIAKLEKLKTGNSATRLYKGRLMKVLPLIHQGEDVNYSAPESKGNTALHYACSLGRAELVQVLLDWGADPEMRTEKGKTPMDCVGGGEADKVKALLQTAIAKKHAPTEISSERANSIGRSFVMLLDMPGSRRMKKIAAEKIILSDSGVMISQEEWLTHIETMKQQWERQHYTLLGVAHTGFSLQLVMRYAMWSSSVEKPVVGHIKVELALNEKEQIYAYQEKDFGEEKPSLDEYYTIDLNKL